MLLVSKSPPLTVPTALPAGVRRPSSQGRVLMSAVALTTLLLARTRLLAVAFDVRHWDLMTGRPGACSRRTEIGYGRPAPSSGYVTPSCPMPAAVRSSGPWLTSPVAVTWKVPTPVVVITTSPTQYPAKLVLAPVG